MPTRNAGLDHHLIACFYPRNEITHFSHDASDIASENVWQRNLNTWQSIANKDVKMVQRARLHFHEYFIGTNLRLGNIGVLEHFRPTVLLEYRGFHFAACSRAW